MGLVKQLGQEQQVVGSIAVGLLPLLVLFVRAAHGHAVPRAFLEVTAAIPLQTPILTKPDRPLYCRHRPCWDWPGGGRRLGNSNQEMTHARRSSPHCSPPRPVRPDPLPVERLWAVLPPSTRCEILRTLSRIVAGRWDAARVARREARDDQA
jgi:hypothetical protein